MPDNTLSRRPIDHDTAADDGAGFHHMHRLDLLMCLHKRVGEFGPDAGVPCPIRVHMGKRLETLEQDRRFGRPRGSRTAAQRAATC